MKTRMSILLFLVLCGCSTTAKFESKLEAWVGKNENELYDSWGPPTESFKKSDGETLLVYNRKNGTETNTSYGYSNTTVGCKTTFTINETKTITKWKWDGRHCKSK